MRAALFHPPHVAYGSIADLPPPVHVYAALRARQPQLATVNDMTDTASVFPSSFELWEFVLAFEDGTLPADAWDDRALAIVAIWYLYLLPPADALARVEAGLHRNRLRFRTHPSALGAGLDSLTEVWPIVLRHVLESFGERNPLSAANRLRACRMPVERGSRAA